MNRPSRQIKSSKQEAKNSQKVKDQLEMNTPALTINDVCDYDVLHVINKLSIPQRISLEAVSKRFRVLVIISIRAMRRLNQMTIWLAENDPLTRVSCWYHDRLVHLILHYQMINLEQLELGKPDGTSCLSPVLLDALATNTPKLRSLKVNGVLLCKRPEHRPRPKDLTSLAECCSGLRQLKISHDFDINDIAGFVAAARSLEKLCLHEYNSRNHDFELLSSSVMKLCIGETNLCNCDVDMMAKNACNLRILKVGQIASSGLETFCKSLKHLQHLTAFVKFDDNSKALEIHSLAALKQIRFLHIIIRDSKKVQRIVRSALTEEFVVDFLTNCRRLNVCNFGDFIRINSESEFSTNASNIAETQEFALVDGPNVSDGIVPILKTWKKLTFLKLVNTGVTDAIREVFESCDELKTIDFSNSSAVTYRTLAAIQDYARARPNRVIKACLKGTGIRLPGSPFNLFTAPFDTEEEESDEEVEEEDDEEEEVEEEVDEDQEMPEEAEGDENFYEQFLQNLFG